MVISECARNYQFMLDRRSQQSELPPLDLEIEKILKTLQAENIDLNREAEPPRHLKDSTAVHSLNRRVACFAISKCESATKWKIFVIPFIP